MTFLIFHPTQSHVPTFSSSRRTKASVCMFLWMSSHSGDLELHFWAMCTTVFLLSTSDNSRAEIFILYTHHFHLSWYWFYSIIVVLAGDERTWRKMNKCAKKWLLFLAFLWGLLELNAVWTSTMVPPPGLFETTHIYCFLLLSLFMSLYTFLCFSVISIRVPVWVSWAHSCLDLRSCSVWLEFQSIQLVTDLHIRWTLSLTFALYSLPM